MEKQLNTLSYDNTFKKISGKNSNCLYTASDRTSKTILGNDILYFSQPPLCSNISITDSINNIELNETYYEVMYPLSKYKEIKTGNIKYYINTNQVDPGSFHDIDMQHFKKKINPEKDIEYVSYANEKWNPMDSNIPRWLYDSQYQRSDIRAKQLNRFIRHDYIPGHLFK
jgi:hypothetical protein